MSSYLTSAQIEAQRAAQMKMELSKAIQNLKVQMRTNKENKVGVTVASHIKTSFIIRDDNIRGDISNLEVSADSLHSDIKESRGNYDFSSLLSSKQQPTKLELELDSWIEKINERPILDEVDFEERKNIIKELSSLIFNYSMDIEDKVSRAKMCVSSFIKGGTLLTAVEQAELKDRYLEYEALCAMTNTEPTEYLPYMIDKAIEEMKSRLEKQHADKYIMDVISSIMEQLGCHVKDEIILDNTPGQLYSVDGQPLCDVFVGNDGHGMLFEPIGSSKNSSLETKRQIENSANTVCSMYSEIEKMAAEKGVILGRIAIAPAKFENMYYQEDISTGSTSHQRKREHNQKVRSLDSEA